MASAGMNFTYNPLLRLVTIVKSAGNLVSEIYSRSEKAQEHPHALTKARIMQVQSGCQGTKKGHHWQQH